MACERKRAGKTRMWATIMAIKQVYEYKQDKSTTRVRVKGRGRQRLIRVARLLVTHVKQAHILIDRVACRQV